MTQRDRDEADGTQWYPAQAFNIWEDKETIECGPVGGVSTAWAITVGRTVLAWYEDASTAKVTTQALGIMLELPTRIDEAPEASVGFGLGIDLSEAVASGAVEFDAVVGAPEFKVVGGRVQVKQMSGHIFGGARGTIHDVSAHRVMVYLDRGFTVAFSSDELIRIDEGD